MEEGGYLFYFKFLNFLPKKIMLVSVKINGKKEVRSLFVEIRFLRSIFFRPPARYVHWASNATLDRPVVCQMTKLEQIKA